MVTDGTPFRIAFFTPHPFEVSPGEAFLNGCPENVRARLVAVLVAVAKAPPYRFRGGGLWEAMKGTMTGWFEVRINVGKSRHYRMYCLLDAAAKNYAEPLLVVITGRVKKFQTVLSAADYEEIRLMGVAYFSSNPRLI